MARQNIPGYRVEFSRAVVNPVFPLFHQHFAIVPRPLQPSAAVHPFNHHRGIFKRLFAGSGAVLSLLLVAKESGDALAVLSTFDGGHDLAVYCKYLLVLLEDDCYILHLTKLTNCPTARNLFVKSEVHLFQT